MAKAPMPTDPDELRERFPSNSFKAREERAKKESEEPTIEPLDISEPVSRKKPSIGKRLRAMFIESDEESVGEHVMGIIVDAAKETIVDAVTCAVEMIFLGESGGGRRRPSHVRRGDAPFDYNKRYSPNRVQTAPRRVETAPIRGYYPDTIEFGNKNDARDCLDKMIDILERYGQVSVGAMYEICRMQTTSADYNYGWTNLNGSRIVRSGDCWIIAFPPTQAI